MQFTESSQEYVCPNGNGKLSSLWIKANMSETERSNLIKDLKMMALTKLISPAFSAHVINSISKEA